MTDWDVVVVGAGPAGTAAAIELARQGASVLLLDRTRFPRWKVCGACLSPGALSLLGALGLEGLPARLGAVPLARLVLSSRAGTVRVPLDGSMAISRAALDLALVHATEHAGVAFWPGARAVLGPPERDLRVLRVVRDGVEVDVAARVVIDATGLGRGLDEDGRETSAAAPRARVGIGAELDEPAYPVSRGDLHMVVGRAGYVGLVRVEGGALNVAAAVDPGALRTATPQEVANGVLAEAGRPALAHAAHHGWRGTPSLMRAAGDVGGERLFRLGDAAGYAEPFTGEGICWALGDGHSAATLAARAVEGWHGDLLVEWRTYRRERRRSSERLCRALAGALRRPWMVDAAVASLRIAPTLAGPFVRRAGRAPEPLAALPV
ncbi:MAG: FAD-dependent oxidoreductase [Gemmatimonadetes bacterium]|nr:FAD-dependent oxidoreductase [Gemmatimonadota bacterium]